jgi:hypothetical protein
MRIANETCPRGRGHGTQGIDAIGAMSDESREQLEQRLATAGPGAPDALRDAVLRDVRRELRAARWDRRLARSAAAALVVGVGWNALNFAFERRGDGRAAPGVAWAAAGEGSRDALVQVAATVAEATDATTGRNVARQLAALSGHTLSAEQAAALDAALRDHEG